jgi:kinetochore protein NDC80
MSADWSAIRRRQTLSEVLSNAPGASQIPQPSSVFKKSGPGRTSVAPGGLAGLGPAPPPRSSLAPARFFRSSSGGNLASEAVGQGTLGGAGTLSSSQTSSQRESLRNSRQSYAPQQSLKYLPHHLLYYDVDGSGRRSSAYTNGRPSSIGFLSQVPLQITKDPRPIKDKTWMAKAQRNIIDYLISANYPVPISVKTLQVPTSKDFATIFKFLYNRTDPNYQFVKKIEDDVVLCLKALKCVASYSRLIIGIPLLTRCRNHRSPL